MLRNCRSKFKEKRKNVAKNPAFFHSLKKIGQLSTTFPIFFRFLDSYSSLHLRLIVRFHCSSLDFQKSKKLIEKRLKTAQNRTTMTSSPTYEPTHFTGAPSQSGVTFSPTLVSSYLLKYIMLISCHFLPQARSITITMSLIVVTTFFSFPTHFCCTVSVPQHLSKTPPLASRLSVCSLFRYSSHCVVRTIGVVRVQLKSRTNLFHNKNKFTTYLFQ